MNKKLFTVSAAALLALSFTLPAAAATVCKTYAEAAATVKDDGYIAFVYGPDWDKRSTALCKKLIADPAVQKAAGDAKLILTPLYQRPSDAQKKEQEAAWGELQTPHQHSSHTYPALHFYDNKGKLAGFVRGPVMMQGDVAAIVAEMEQRMKEIRQRRELLTKADAAQGVEKAKLLGEACRVPHTERPDKVVDAVKAADPKDESGFVRSLSMGDSSFAESSKDLPLEEGLKQMDKNLADPAYTNEQKQVFCCVAIGLLHRNGTKADNERIVKYADKMKELVPDNYLARSADIAKSIWVKGLSYEGGWNSDALADGPGVPILLQGELPIRKPGTYTVTFNFSGGSDALLIKAVEARDGDKVLVKDEHEGFAGRKADKNSYTLNLKSVPKNLKLYITFGNQMTSRDTSGTISISKGK